MMGFLRSKAAEVLKATLPLIVVIIVLQFTIINMPLDLFIRFLLSSVMVVAGMTLFLLGVDIGILPMGQAIGSALPSGRSVSLIALITFLIGFTATIAEPDVMVLTSQINRVTQGRIADDLLIYVIGIGVAFFVVLAVLRIIFGFRMVYLLGGSYLIILILSFFTPVEFVPVAFDAGGVTTGPMTVPVILALGIGISSVLKGRSAISDGFGMIGLASVGPILAVMLLGIISGRAA